MRKMYAASGNLFTVTWSWQSFVSSCLRFWLSFCTGCTKWNTAAIKIFRYPWLVCFLSFWLRNAPLVKVIGNPISDGIVFVFHLAWCARGLKSLKRFWCYLIPFRAASRLSNYCIWCLFVSLTGFMKSSLVYVASLCRFVRFEALIWSIIRFDIQNFKKPLDIF